MNAAADRVLWWLCWCAWHVVMRLPLEWRLTGWLLPWAGLYAYSDDYDCYLASRAWHRAGRPEARPE